MRITSVIYSNRGIQLVYESCCFRQTSGVIPITRWLRVMAEKIKPPVTRDTELVDARQHVFVGGLKETQISWEWR